MRIKPHPTLSQCLSWWVTLCGTSLLQNLCQCSLNIHDITRMCLQASLGHSASLHGGKNPGVLAGDRLVYRKGRWARVHHPMRVWFSTQWRSLGSFPLTPAGTDTDQSVEPFRPPWLFTTVTLLIDCSCPSAVHAEPVFLGSTPE